MEAQMKRMVRHVAASIAIALAFAAVGVHAETNSCAKGTCSCKAASVGTADASQVEIDVRFVEAGRAALDAVGYFDPGDVDAAVLQERLLSRKDVKQRETLRVLARLGEKGVAKRVTEYIYPTEYRVRLKPKAGVEPEKFKMREVGVTVQAETTFIDVEDQFALKFDAEIVDEPEWVSCGTVKAYEDDVAKHDVSMEQPIFQAVRFGADAKVRLGRSYVFGGMATLRKGNEDKVVLAFVTLDRVSPAPSANGE